MKNGLISTTRKARNGSLARSVFRRLAAAADPAGSAASGAVWVYAVTADLDADLISGLTGVAGEPVRVVTEAGLGAVVGSVNDGVLGERPLTSLLTDLTSVEKVGRAHHKVIASAASAGPVVPLRLATTYPDDATIRVLLAAHNAALSKMLRDFTGRQEWGVKVYVEPREWRWVTAEAWVEKIGQALSSIAVATRRHPPAGPPPGDQAGWMALNGAYLLSAERAAEFEEIVQTFTAEHDALRADVTGPWPPYSFADTTERRGAAS